MPCHNARIHGGNETSMQAKVPVKSISAWKTKSCEHRGQNAEVEKKVTYDVCVCGHERGHLPD